MEQEPLVQTKFKIILKAMGILVVLIALSISIKWILLMSEYKILKTSITTVVNIIENDPAKIEYADQAVIVRHLYSTLFIYDLNSQLVLNAATDFSIENNILKIEMKPKIKLINGRFLNAKDAEYSFKRLIALSSNTHGDLNTFLVDGNTLLIDKPWEQVWSKDETLFFKLRYPESIHLFINLLASTDYSIIPFETIDWSKTNMPIVDYKNTSGPYHFASADKLKCTLLANTSHPFISNDSPKEIQLFSTWGERSVELLKNNQMDLMPTIDPISKSNLSFLEKNGYRIQKTLPIYSFNISFTSEGRSRFSKNKRLAIAARLRNSFEKKSNQIFSDFDPSFQMTSPLSESALNEEDINNIKLLYDTNIKIKDILSKKSPKLKMIAYALSDEEYSQLFGEIEWIERIKPKKVSESTQENEIPDLIFMGTDSNFYEGIVFLSYNISMKIFTLPPNLNEKSWVKIYLSESNKQNRIKMSQTIQYYNISEGFLIPLGHKPYYAISTNKISPQIFKEFAEIYFWMVK